MLNTFRVEYEPFFITDYSFISPVNSLSRSKSPEMKPGISFIALQMLRLKPVRMAPISASEYGQSPVTMSAAMPNTTIHKSRK